jgi:DNA-directed RNA polymerase subunit RPC12/RpoP
MTQRKLVVMPDSEVPPEEVSLIEAKGDEPGPLFVSEDPVGDVEYVCGSCGHVLIEPLPADGSLTTYIRCFCGATNFADVRAEAP